MKINKEQIGAFMPQRPPFIMVDNLIDATNERFETDFYIAPDNIFLEGELLREFALIENIAQSSAVGLAFQRMNTHKKQVEGFIGGIAKLNLYALPKVNHTIITSVTLLTELGNMFLLTGVNYSNGIKLLECDVKLVGR